MRAFRSFSVLILRPSLISHLIPITYYFLLVTCSPAAGLLVEAEAFADRGGWSLDTQFTDLMGSSYLLAHGLGAPVADAVTEVALPQSAVWRVWARTRNWVPGFDGEAAPGRFQILVNGTPLAPTFGATGGTWHWQDGGTVALPAGGATLALRDLTGFDGRCDALYLTTDTDAPPPPDSGPDLEQWRAELRGETTPPAVSEAFDLVVVGGGIAGTCAAVAAAEQGLTVALIQDRPTLGGNASGEIRVRTEGEKRHRIVAAVANDAPNTSPNALVYEARRMAYVATNAPSVSLFTGWRATGLVTNGQRRITAVDARETATGERRRFTAPLFVDATGDAWLGYWAGAAFRMGSEARTEFGESLAPAAANAMTMGNTLMWTSADTGVPSVFPSVPWALPIAGSSAETGGEWNWEYGLDRNTITDAEEIRDHLLRAIYGNFYNAKNKPANANRALTWVPYVAGKRESRRIMGDRLLTQHDVVNGVYFEDAVGTATWPIDDHFPVSPGSYRTRAVQTTVGKWHFPYRSLYSRDIPNLFMAGRNISVTHVALGSPRVMNTCGQMGVAVGTAAALCKAYTCLPRDIYRHADRTAALKALIGGTFPARVINEPDPPPAAVLILDNTEAAVSGAWVTSTWDTGNFEGANYLHDNNTGKGPDKWVRYTPDIPVAADYVVYQKWSADTGRSSNVVIEIVHGGVTNTVAVDMRKNGGVWNRLGVWRFPQGTGNNSLRILTEGATPGHVMADAFKLEHVPVLVVDNPDAEVSGAWVSSVSMTGQFYGTNYLHNNKVASESLWVRYCPDLPETGLYRLQGIWNGPNDRPTAARLEVVHAGGVTTNLIDMTKNIGVWHTVGYFTFASGTNGSVRLLTLGSSGKSLIADAFRWTRTDVEIPVPTPDDWDANGLPDAWERFHFLNEGGTDPQADPDGDGYGNLEEFRHNTDPLDPRSHPEAGTRLLLK